MKTLLLFLLISLLNGYTGHKAAQTKVWEACQAGGRANLAHGHTVVCSPTDSKPRKVVT